MKKRQPQPDPEIVRFRNCTAKVVHGFSIIDLSEADIRLLYDGHVPAWIHDTVAFWLRDQPTPSDVPPKAHEATVVSEVA